MRRAPPPERPGDAVLGQLTSWVGDGASWLLLQVADAIDSTTSVNLSAPWFQSHYAFMFQAGAILLLPLLLLTVLQALIRQDAGLLVRVGLLHLPAAMLLTGLAVSVTQTALAVTDALSAELTAGVAKDTQTLASTLTQTSAIGGPVPLFASFLMALVMALAAIFVWFELILRAGVVYVAVMFLPLFLATMIWPATSGWVRRLVQLIVAAILSKLVIVATLSLGLSALTSGDGVSAVLAGAGMFMIAAFSPFVLFSLIPLAAEVAQPQREGRHALATATGDVPGLERRPHADGLRRRGSGRRADGARRRGDGAWRGRAAGAARWDLRAARGAPPAPARREARPAAPGGAGAAGAPASIVRSAAPTPAPSTPPATPAASPDRPPATAPRPMPPRPLPATRPYLGGGDGI